MMMRWFPVAFLNKQLRAKPLSKGSTNRHEYNAYISQPSDHNDMDLDQLEYARLQQIIATNARYLQTGQSVYAFMTISRMTHPYRDGYTNWHDLTACCKSYNTIPDNTFI